MTIPKNSKRAKSILANAESIKCYSLNNGFSGKRVEENPTIWRSTGNPAERSQLVHVTPAEFLQNQLADAHAKLTDKGSGNYVIHIHSNLWYEFESMQREESK